MKTILLVPGVKHRRWSSLTASGSQARYHYIRVVFVDNRSFASSEAGDWASRSIPGCISHHIQPNKH
jgi:hypothetical protein